MKIAYITAGAAGMYCGSCLHDNTLAATLIAQGHEALLIPTYTPIRTDEVDVSQKRVFFGGINVYLQQKLSLFRHTPWLLDRLLDGRGLLRWVSRFAVTTQAQDLGDLTVSMLQGELGRQRKEVAKLTSWLARDLRPEIVCLSTALLSGSVHEIKARMRVPVVCMLQGDDVFLEALPQPHRSTALKLISEHCQEIDGFIATSAYYADFMASYLAVPRPKIEVVLPGLNLTGHGKEKKVSRNPKLTIGYFARVCPEKGLHNLVKAFQILCGDPNSPRCRLRVSGWLGGNDRRYFAEQQRRMQVSGLAEVFEYVDSPDHASKVRFFQSLDVLSVPTTYREPKGLYILEALANGVPVVQPRHGSFPELVGATGGGLLVEPDNPEDLARGLGQLLKDETIRLKFGQTGKRSVFERFHAQRMADETMSVFRKFVK